MNGNVGIIVFTRGTHGCLSRHTWRGNIPFIKRSARSSHRHTYTRGHRCTVGEGYATLFRLPGAGVDTSDVFRISSPPSIPPRRNGGDFPRLVIIPAPLPPLPHPLKIIPRAMERGNTGDSVSRAPSRARRGGFVVEGQTRIVPGSPS